MTDSMDQLTAGKTYKIGSIISTDLTVDDADSLKDFYQAVIGWDVENFNMGNYNDYMLKSADGKELVGGICHSEGSNRNLPPVWLVYINVADLAQSARKCEELGGKVLVENDQYAVIQ